MQFDLVMPHETFSVYDFRHYALEKIKAIISRGKTPIVVGGTGLYIRALTQGLAEGVDADEGYRADLEKKIEDNGLESLVIDLLKSSLGKCFTTSKIVKYK